MTYSNDSEWNYAKKVVSSGGHKNNWIYVIDFYNSIGGKNVNIFCAIEQEKFRILYMLDDDSVLLLDKKDNLVSEEYEIVEESRKIFFFEPDPKKVTQELPKGLTYDDSNEVEFYV